MSNFAIMYSGGADSTTIIAQLIEAKVKGIYPLVFDDDSVNFKTRRMVAIEQIMQHYGLYRNLQIIRSYNIDPLRQQDTFGFIPGWKLTMQMAAMAHCQALKCDYLYMGYCKENEDYPYTYKDELEENILRAAELYNHIYDANIEVILPYLEMTKKDILELGIKLGVPYHKTISCRATELGGLIHCGKCLPCKSRIRGFDDAKIPDPTLYWNRDAAPEKVVMGTAGTITKSKLMYLRAGEELYNKCALISNIHYIEWKSLSEAEKNKWIGLTIEASKPQAAIPKSEWYIQTPEQLYAIYHRKIKKKVKSWKSTSNRQRAAWEERFMLNIDYRYWINKLNEDAL